MKLYPVESGQTHLLVHSAALLLIDSLALRKNMFFINDVIVNDGSLVLVEQ